MHAGFTALRNELPMNCRAIRRVEPSAAARADIARIDEIWSRSNEKHARSGPWLFGEFSIADCFFAPVALRFATYDIGLSDPAREYCSLLLAHESVVRWKAAGSAETEIIPEDEAGI
jgi:glutathione S-transferase